MAVREIKTTIALDGEQKFKQAIAGATREMRVMESELKAISAAYDVNGDSASYYAQKQSNLRNQINQQAGIIKSLEQAVEDATKAYGAGSKEVDGYAIKLNNAHTKMSRLEKQLEETDREMEELGRDSVKVGRQIDDGIGDGAEAANADLRELYDTMSRDLGSIRASTAITAVKGLWDTASGAFSAVSGFVDGTVEYRRSLSFLEQNAKTAGFDFDTVKQQLIEVQTLTGDAQSGVEAVSNLLAADLDAGQMDHAIDLLAGAVIRFPNTLKFESLADGLQETLATGTATGQFAELLERLGVDVEEFNAALEESPTAAGDADIALGYLASAGLKDVYDSYSKANDSMLDAQRTNAELEAELAEFGGTLEQYITTPVKQKFVEAMQWVNDKIAEIEASGEEVTAGTMIGIATGAAASGIATAAKETAEAIASDAAYAAKGFIKPIIYGAEPQIMSAATAMHAWGRDTTEAEELALLAERAATEPRGVTYYDGDRQMLLDSLPTPEESTSLIDDIFAALEKATAEKTPALASEWEASGDESMDAFAKATRKGVEDVSGGAYDAGLSVASRFANGMLGGVPYVRSAASALGAVASAGMRGASVPTTGSHAIFASLNIDGREFARLTAPFMDTELQQTVK